ncbi:hypothetical protein QBC44DRAFT_337787 [Cladorrhinum sp. PSN332]|nr:hypothetical protein QBC44DRAFT_337787 [Cladorrhinum sp. PSN332]
MSSTAQQNRAMVLTSFASPATLTTRPSPPTVPPNTGTLLLRVLSTPIIPYAYAVQTGLLSAQNLPGPLPLVPNPNGIARIVSCPPDALYLKENQLVYIDCTIRARDDPLPDVPINIAGHSAGQPGDKASEEFLKKSPWRDGTLQDYMVLPLENVYPLDEQRLTKELGYTHAELSTLTYYTVAAGAIMEAGKVQVGETVVVGPVGGSFGGAAVDVALALGAGRVIILGRQEEKLKEMKTRLGEKVEYVVMSGDVEVDAENIRSKTPGGKGADLYNDWSPFSLEEVPFLEAAVRSLVKRGRVVLSGAPRANLKIPYVMVSMMELKIMGKNMFSRETPGRVIKLVEQGVLDIGRDGKGVGVEVKEFELEGLQDALKHSERGGWRNYTVVSPNSN